MGRIKTIMMEAHVPKTRRLVKACRITDRSFDNLRGLSYWSDRTSFRRGCNLSQICIFLLMSCRSRLWVVTVILGIVQRVHIFIWINSFSCHQRQAFFNLLLLISCECWRLVRVVSIVFMDAHGFTLFSILYHVIYLWMILLFNVKWL